MQMKDVNMGFAYKWWEEENNEPHSHGSPLYKNIKDMFGSQIKRMRTNKNANMWVEYKSMLNYGNLIRIMLPI